MLNGRKIIKGEDILPIAIALGVEPNDICKKQNALGQFERRQEWKLKTLILKQVKKLTQHVNIAGLKNRKTMPVVITDVPECVCFYLKK